MNFWYQHALVNIWKKCRASTLAFKADRFLRFFVFSLHSSFWRVDPPSVHTYAALCWCWKRICHNRRYSMSLAFKRPLYNVLTCLGSHDWRLFQSAIWAIFRPLRNSWFRWLACLILEDLLLDPPVEPQQASATCLWTSAKCQMLKWGHAAVTWKNSRPARGGAAIRRSPSNKVEVPWIVLLVFVACISFSLHGCWQSTMSSFQWSHTKNGCMLFSGIASYPSPSQPNVSQLRRYAGSQSLPRPPLAAGWWWQPQEDERQRLWTAHAQCKTNQGAMQQCETNHGCQVFTKCI